MSRVAAQNAQHERLDGSVLDRVIANTTLADRPQSLESEQLEIQVVTAKRYPRSIRQFLAAAESMAIINQETAASCFYSVPRGGKPISGPSIRLAEICMSCWGHLDAGTRVKEIAETYIVVEGFAWDMEKNIKVRQEVRRNIMTSAKNGQQPRRYSEDMIANTVNAGASIALRNAILRVIPRAYVDQLWEEARKVAVGDAKTLSQTRDVAVNYFTKAGVLAERIYAALGVQGIEDLTIDHVGILKGYATAVKDGEATLDECFPPNGKAGDESKTLADKIKSASNGTKPPETKPEPKPEPPAAAQEPPQPGELPPDAPMDDAPMSDEEKAAIAAQEAAQHAPEPSKPDPEKMTKDELMAAVREEMKRTKTPEKLACRDVNKMKLEYCSEGELRIVLRSLNRMIS